MNKVLLTYLLISLPFPSGLALARDLCELMIIQPVLSGAVPGLLRGIPGLYRHSMRCGRLGAKAAGFSGCTTEILIPKCYKNALRLFGQHFLREKLKFRYFKGLFNQKIQDSWV